MSGAEHNQLKALMQGLKIFKQIADCRILIYGSES